MHEVANRTTLQPLVKRDGKSHFILSFKDGLGKHRSHCLAKDILVPRRFQWYWHNILY